MASYIFYEPFSFEIEPSLSKQYKSGCNASRPLARPVRSFEPRLDLHENIEKNLVTATFELPGFSKEDVQLNFQNGKLTVSAETKKSEDRADTGYSSRERLYGKFSRTLQLPQGVQDEHIKASMENGLLIVRFPKTLPENAPKKIVIQASDKEDYDTDFNL